MSDHLPHTQRVVGDPGLDRFKDRLVARDEFGQPVGDWSDFDLDLLAILEEVATPDESGNPGKTLAAYMADIKDLFAFAETVPRRRREH